MGNIWIRDFGVGLDVRRMSETTEGGALVKAIDGHITSGREFEKRAAFIPVYALPTGETTGLAATRSGLAVFGETTEPAGIPSGVTYQRLEHPSVSATELSRVRSHDLNKGLIYAAAEFADNSVHHYLDGTNVANWYDGSGESVPAVSATGRFTLVGSAGSIDSITVDGVELLSSPVTFDTSLVVTAMAIAEEINGNATTPDYTAISAGAVVVIQAGSAEGADANNRVIVISGSGGLIGDFISALAGGVTTTTSYLPGPFVRTVGSRMLALANSNLHGSGVDDPDDWRTSATGSFFINFASQASGAERLYALAEYQQYVAIFAEDVTFIWFIDPDPTNNAKSQILKNTGTSCPRSVTQFGDNDVFYLHESGLRSLQARDASNAASTADVGVPVDKLIGAKLRSLTEAERDQVIGIINPRDGRFWLCMRDEIYVFSFYEDTKVSAWSTYLPSYEDMNGDLQTLSIDDVVVWNRRVYVRSGDTIYVYGGLGNEVEYDSTQAIVWTPYFDANKPTAVKEWSGVDAAIEGMWEVRLAMQPTDAGVSDLVATIDKTSYNLNRLSGSGQSTHASLRFTSQGNTGAKLSAAVIHYVGEDDED